MNVKALVNVQEENNNSNHCSECQKLTEDRRLAQLELQRRISHNNKVY